MSDVQELVQKLGVSRRTVCRLVWGCVEEKIIVRPERGRRNELILSRESKRILCQVYDRRKREVSSVVSLAEEVGRSLRAVHAVIQRLVKKRVISSPKRVRGKISLSLQQKRAILDHYKWLDEYSSVIALARELGVPARRVRYKIHQLVEKGKFPPPEKIRRAGVPEMVLSKNMKEETKKSFSTE